MVVVWCFGCLLCDVLRMSCLVSVMVGVLASGDGLEQRNTTKQYVAYSVVDVWMWVGVGYC